MVHIHIAIVTRGYDFNLFHVRQVLGWRMDYDDDDNDVKYGNDSRRKAKLLTRWLFLDGDDGIDDTNYMSTVEWVYGCGRCQKYVIIF